jgi:hypothetical protein
LLDYQHWPDNFGVEDRCRQLDTEAASVMNGVPLKRLSALIARIRAANHGGNGAPGRNDLVHGPWIETPAGVQMIVRDKQGHIVGEKAMQMLLAEIRSVRDELNSFPWPKLDVAQQGRLMKQPRPHDYRPKKTTK